MANKFQIQQVIKQIEEVKKNLPPQLGAQAQNFFLKSFDDGGFTDASLVLWPESQRRKPGTKAYKSASAANRQKPTEVMSGAERRAVANSVKEATFQRVRLVVALPYAEIQNQGGIIHKESRSATAHFRRKKNGQIVFSTEKKAKFGQRFDIGEHDINIPARPYMKHSKTLEKMQFLLINGMVDKTFKIK